MKIVAATRYGNLGASSRVRFFQYFPALKELIPNLVLREQHLLADEYLQRKYAGAPTWPWIAKGYFSRLRALAAEPGSDAIWLEKELWPWLPAAFEKRVMRGAVYAIDIDDAVFHNYDMHGNPTVRRLMGSKIDRVMQGAALVTAGNEYLADRAREAGASRIEIVPTVVDLARYPMHHRSVAEQISAERPFVVGWIGSPSTSQYLDVVAAPLAALAKTLDLEVRVIGAQIQLPGVNCVCIPWTEAGEAAAIADFDVGIMPLVDSPWERGKCGYKLIQYMASSLPVMASPVGVNPSIVRAGHNGILADSHAQWLNGLSDLARDPAKRREFGAAGRMMVEQQYSLQVTAPRLADLLSKLARRG